jgi:CheY-like chemotaxis protein
MMKESLTSTAITTGGNTIVWIIDDDTVSRFLTRKILEIRSQQSLDIIEFSSAREAIKAVDKLRSLPPDVIFLDIDMPHMSGWDFLDYLEKEEKLRSSRIAMLASSGNHDDSNRALSYDRVNLYFQKPLKIEHIKDLMLLEKVMN